MTAAVARLFRLNSPSALGSTKLEKEKHEPKNRAIAINS
jgi:hypothetical protein